MRSGVSPSPKLLRAGSVVETTLGKDGRPPPPDARAGATVLIRIAKRKLLIASTSKTDSLEATASTVENVPSPRQSAVSAPTLESWTARNTGGYACSPASASVRDKSERLTNTASREATAEAPARLWTSTEQQQYVPQAGRQTGKQRKPRSKKIQTSSVARE